ncbi:CaiB/BaiF CoA transferase family protein [Pollutimonas bauzanensis]|uniref:Crotonobetainyl-CoA:carnitine CoA-transferase CaiB n=1 Tax=Pollutimonas bauzanensis TaxID=658167 RepID=A0A1M5X9F6_9BURK|nr:CaiB/BaiF CoA-transferase family protein [Pollutimonas bauzanensis]SHH96460.1 Crotonobetainyl-CoA:carnitine CoA-transferase CaiB [Pollutimonas bauzanensis]
MNHSTNNDPIAGRAVQALPYQGIRVVEFSHMVMGPACGMVLADLGAEVIKIEPVGGDNTRHLKGSGAGFFPMFNRNKKSLPVNIKSAEGRELVLKLIGTADIVTENFKPGAMAKMGFGYETLKKLNPGLIYVSHKGFLPGPYEHRTALDEVVQMMGGLAYMTGPEGRPLRAGAAVNDIMGGVFGALGAIVALWERARTGLGQEVQSALFENNVFLVGNHMLQHAATGAPAAPMPSRVSAWAIYDVFTVANDAQIFLAVVSDTQWEAFCRSFSFDDLANDVRLTRNNDRVAARGWLMPELRKRLSRYTISEIEHRFEAGSLPYAPIGRPEDLYTDQHLLETGGLADIKLPDNRHCSEAKTPLLPFTLGGRRLGVRLNPPELGENGRQLLGELDFNIEQISELQQKGVIGALS